MEWQPIKTAPHGEEVDLWCTSDIPGDDGGYRVANAWWCQVDKRWRTQGDKRLAWVHRPTHWMQLPNPPKTG